MSQTSVSDYPLAVYEGMLAEPAPMGGIVSAFAHTAGILFGKAAGRRDGDVAPGDNAAGGQEVEGYAAANSADNLIGIALADVSKETDASKAYGDYVGGDTVPVLKRGRVWVVSADAVDDLTKSVFVRNANAGSLPAAGLGSFRATTAADHIDLGAIAAVRWVAYRLQGSVHYGMLEINLP